jgi:hypothetical protein
MKEALNMFDSYSDGSVFYGRSLAIVVGFTILAILLNLL